MKKSSLSLLLLIALSACCPSEKGNCSKKSLSSHAMSEYPGCAYDQACQVVCSLGLETDPNDCGCDSECDCNEPEKEESPAPVSSAICGKSAQLNGVMA